MKPTTVTAKLAVAPQPVLSDFQEFRRLGFTTIVNNRPDGEDPNQPGSATEEQAARAAGLGYVHIPVMSTGMNEDDARLLKETIEQAPGPVVAHCKSGVRSAKAVEFLKQAGFKKVKNMKGGILAWSDKVDPKVPKY